MRYDDDGVACRVRVAPPRARRPDRSRRPPLRGVPAMRVLARRVADMPRLPLSHRAFTVATAQDISAAELRLALRQGEIQPQRDRLRVEAAGVVVILSCTCLTIIACWRQAVGPFEVDDVLEVSR